MASQHIQIVTPPSKDATVQAFLQNLRAHNEPGSAPLVFGGGQLHAEMPLLLNVPGASLPCREPAADFGAVNAHFSAQVHAFFNGLHEIEDMAAKQSPDEPALIDAVRGLQPSIRIGNQVIQSDPDAWGRDRTCLHRAFHSRRLTVQNVDSLPVLNRVTELLLMPEEAFTGNPLGMRPVSMRTPLDLATRLPQLRRLLCPWLGERFPIPFTSKALRIVSRVWAGPWRDDRAEFARGVRQAVPLLPSSLTKVRLWFWRPHPYCWDEMDQAEQLPDLVGASSSSANNEFNNMDPVSLGLRELGSRLEELEACAPITPDLFPSGGDALSWTRMRRLRIEFHPCAPDGSWYFSGPRGEDPYPEGFAITREAHYPLGRENEDETHELLSEEED